MNQFQDLALTAGGSSDDEDITSQLLSMLAEEMSSNAKKRKRSAQAARQQQGAKEPGGGSPESSWSSASPPESLASSPRAPTRPRLAAHGTDELKKEKNRNSVKRSYYRKLVRCYRQSDGLMEVAGGV